MRKYLVLLASVSATLALVGCSSGGTDAADAGPAPKLGGKLPPVTAGTGGGGATAGPSGSASSSEAK